MKKTNLIPLTLLVLLKLNQPLAAQTVHQFSGITALPDKTISLSLTGSVDAIFGQYFDQYVIEASTNLLDWSPLVTLQHTNRPSTILTYHDKVAAQFDRRFYRIFTNHLITPLPQPTGAYAVGTFSRLLTDPSRTNEVRGTNHQFMVTFWFPANAQAAQLPAPYLERQVAERSSWGQAKNPVPDFFSHSLPNVSMATNQFKYPVVLYSHSLNSHRRENTDKTEDLASQRYIVVALDHRETIFSVFPDGTGIPGQLVNGNDISQVRAAIQDRVLDEQFVLDELARLNETDPLLGGRLDLEHVGAFGFSLGGATSAELCRVEARCQAAVNMDGAFFSDSLVQQGLSRPFMILRADGLDPASTTDDRKQVYEKLGNNAYWVKLTNTVHGSFWENSIILDPITFQQRNNRPSPIQPGVRTSQVARAYLVSFLNKYLKSVDDHLLDGPSADYPEVMEFLKK